LSRHPGRNPRLRIAEAADAAAVTRLINNAFQVERYFLGADRIGLEEVRARIDRGKFILAEEDAQLTGCVYVEPGGERAYLGLLAVEPSLQRAGRGKQLMDAAEHHCRAAGCRVMDLRVVNLRTELPPFYRKLGYVETGAMPFPEEVRTIVPCHLLIMSKPLTPPEIQP
jgi:N-acetylglutamate synthase-like GNAT family acetyltransferase